MSLFYLSSDLDWQKSAECSKREPSLGDRFFPAGRPSRDSKELCGSCPVRDECLEWALTNQEQWGIWGGLSERERERLLAERTK